MNAQRPRHFQHSIRRWMIVIAALALGITTTVALAASQGPVPTYTGCINLSSGTLSALAEGESPKAACSTNEKQVRLSGGDITAIATPAPGGLEGGTDNGAATIGLQQGFRLPQGCAAGEVVKAGNGSWACGTDNNTTYRAGTGVALDGNEFSVTPAHRLPQGCSAGQGPSWTGATWGCQTSSSRLFSWSSPRRWTTLTGFLSGAKIPFCGFCFTSDGRDFRRAGGAPAPVKIVKTMQLPPGSYFVMAKAVLYNHANELLQDNKRTAGCWLSTSTGTVDFAELEIDGDFSSALALTLAETFATGGDIQLVCNALGGSAGLDDDAFVGEWSGVNAAEVRITAVTVDAIQSTTGWDD